MENLQKKRTGMDRIIHAFGYSMQGIRATYQHEAAFRQEVMLLLFAFPLAFLLGDTLTESLLMIAAVLFVMIVELLNSAVESVVDRMGLEHHELAGRAKDQGSAAVLMAILVAIISWIAIILL